MIFSRLRIINTAAIIKELKCRDGNLLIPGIYCEKNKKMCKEFYVNHDNKCKNCVCNCPCECLNKKYEEIMNNDNK